MKKIFAIFFSPLLLGAALAENYYYVGSASAKFEEPAAWSITPDGLTPATVAPSATTDMIINSATTVDSIVMTYYGASQFNNFIVDESYQKAKFNFGGWNAATASQWVAINGGIDVAAYTAGSERSIAFASLTNGPTGIGIKVIVKGNVNIEQGNTIKFGSQESSYNPKLANYVEIGAEGVSNSGNVTVKAGAKAASLRFGAADLVGGIASSASNPNVLVRGTIDLSTTGAGIASVVLYGGDSASYNTNEVKRTTFVKVGGISGAGNIYGDTAATYASDTAYAINSNLVFANSTSSTFSGNILKVFNEKTSRRAQDVSLNISMLGSGTQTIKGDTVEVTSVGVSSGTLNISNSSGGYGDIALDGGTLGVAPNGTLSVGNFSANSLTWNGGKIAIAIVNGTADSFNVSDFNKGIAEKFVFDFNIVGNIAEGEDYLIAIVENNFGFADSDFSGVVNGYTANFKWVADEASLYVSFTQVPEPSDVAAMLGILALAAAFLRRSRK